MNPSKLNLAMRQLTMHKAWPDFILQLIRSAGILIPTAGAEQSLLFREGQRSLGLDIIRWSADACGLSIEQYLARALSDPTPKETDNEISDPERI